MLSAFLMPETFVFAGGDDNATSGDGTTHSAAQGFGWYNAWQYMYKVTLFVGKKDTSSRSSSLTNDFYRIGTVIMKEGDWDLGANVMFGNGTKVDYYAGAAMTRITNPYVLNDNNLPKIPIACKGDIDVVKQYFGSTGTMNAILNALAAKDGTTAYGLLKNKTFTIRNTTKSGWQQEVLLPNGTTNKVPWVIVYEPVILMHLKDKRTEVAFTATEFAIAQLNGWYDWKYSNGTGQGVEILPRRHLPSSVQLEESWFGYPVYPTRGDDYQWPWEDIIKGGGWGMRWLGANVDDDIDFSCKIIEYDPSPVMGETVAHKIRWYNNKSKEKTVLCEIYSGDTRITSQSVTIPGNSSVVTTVNLIYRATVTHKMIAKINYDFRNDETNPNNNTSTVTVIPKSSENPPVDYLCQITDVETPEPNGAGTVRVKWRNAKRDYGTVLCELFRDDTLIWMGIQSFEGYENKYETYNIYYPGTSSRTITARINYANRNNEVNPTDNLAETVVTPVSPVDTTYDFSVQDLTLSSYSPYMGNKVIATFRADNWNKDLSYENIPVELLVNGQVVKSTTTDFIPGGTVNYVFEIDLGEVGAKTIAARINYEDRYSEDNATNNYTDTLALVQSPYDFSVTDLEVMPATAEKNGTVTLTFKTQNNDVYNTYMMIPVEILYDDVVVSTTYEVYGAYAQKSHTVSLNVGGNVGVHNVKVRINWAGRTSETNAANNITDAKAITVINTGDLRIKAVTPDAFYREGFDVITSFIVYNDSDEDVIPDSNNTVRYKVYYVDNGQTTIITQKSLTKVVIPAGDSNLVWIKWTVPENFAGKTVYVEAEVNYGRTVAEKTHTNNKDSLGEVIAPRRISSTPDTQYEREKPQGFTIPAKPSVYNESLTWSVWTYTDGEFQKVNYGLSISKVTALITPDSNAPSAKKVNGKWVLKSGYGFAVSYSSSLQNASGCELPNTGAYTGTQVVLAHFPEFGYGSNTGLYRNLEKVSGKWQFKENPYAENSARIHFTPIWYPDGDYTVNIIASDCWTPAGMLMASGNVTFKIEGSVYDDWFLGR